MTAIRDLPSGYGSAVFGIHRAIDRFERSAATVATAGPAENNAVVLHISDAARGAARAAAERAPSLEDSLVDSRIASHDLAANVRTLQTSDEMMRELLATFDDR